MATRPLLARTKFHVQAWQVGLVPCIPIVVVVGTVAAMLGSDWRETLALFPTDPGPAAGLFLTGIAAALSMLLGLALLVSMDVPIGAWMLAFGVALIVGAIVGFWTGPDLVDVIPAARVI
jgi:hypothetical protein